MTTTAATEPQQASVVIPRMSYDEWLAWDHEGSLTEWVNGEVVVHMDVLFEHQRLADFLNRLLGFFAEMFQLGVVASGPMVMRILPGGNAREPDLCFVAQERVAAITNRQLEGSADLVIEIISEDSVQRDREDKFYEYQDGGVREYWIIDPRVGRQRLDIYVLDARQRYRAILPDDQDRFHSTVIPRLWVKEEWLWQEQPNVLAALGEVVGVERMITAFQETQKR